MLLVIGKIKKYPLISPSYSVVSPPFKNLDNRTTVPYHKFLISTQYHS